MGDMRVLMVVRHVINRDKAELARAELTYYAGLLPESANREHTLSKMQACIRRLMGALSGDMDVEVDEANRLDKLDLMLPVFDAMEKSGFMAARIKANQLTTGNNT